METICKNGRLKAIFFKSFSRHMRKPSYATKHLVMAPYRHSIIAMRTRQLGARTLTKRHSAASRLAPPWLPKPCTACAFPMRVPTSRIHVLSVP